MTPLVGSRAGPVSSWTLRGNAAPLVSSHGEELIMRRYAGTELFISKRRYMAAQNEINAAARAERGERGGRGRVTVLRTH